MPQLVFLITPDGLSVDVLVNLDAATLQSLWASGAGPSPVPARGLIDTGTDITAVSLPILQQLGVPVSQQRVTHGIGGGLPVKLYRVGLHIVHLNNLADPWFSHLSLLVMGLPTLLPIDVLIGLDVLRTCNTFIEGRAGRFTLDF
jgi:hypothetical protein